MTIGAGIEEGRGRGERVGERLDESGYSMPAWFEWRLGRARIFIDVNNAARGGGIWSGVGGVLRVGH